MDSSFQNEKVNDIVGLSNKLPSNSIPSKLISLVVEQQQQQYNVEQNLSTSNSNLVKNFNSTPKTTQVQTPSQNSPVKPKSIFSSNYQDTEMDVLIEMVILTLETIIKHNDQIPIDPECLTQFHSSTPPLISLRDYIKRIVRFALLEKTCLLMIMAYIDRLCKSKNFVISSLTVHRVLASTVVISCKTVCDNYFSNSHYAKIVGLGLVELNSLEMETLTRLDWKLSVSFESLQHYYIVMVKNMIKLNPNFTSYF